MIYLPVPFFVNLLKINSLLVNLSVACKKEHVAVRTPYLVHKKSQHTYDEDMQEPIRVCRGSF